MQGSKDLLATILEEVMIFPLLGLPWLGQMLPEWFPSLAMVPHMIATLGWEDA